MKPASTSTHAASSVTPGQSRRYELVLSLFPGAGLMDFGFTRAGYCVVRGPDLLLGTRIEDFHINESRFNGIIGGPPCQDFSRARRQPPSGHGLRMLTEFRRLITEGQPDWWLCENVPGIPDLHIEGYTLQRFNLFASEFGLNHRRNRSFQFGSRGQSLMLARVSQSHPLKPTPLASAATRNRRANFADFCESMGLPRDFNLPGLSRSAKYRAIGNGVPVPMAYSVAVAIQDRSHPRGHVTPCPCQCGRPLTGNQLSATVACRKRLQRKRELSRSTTPPATILDRRVTQLNPPAESHPRGQR